MQGLWRAGAFIVFALFSTPALPWGADGHQAVGAIADQLLAGTNAGQKVREILGFELKQAGPWADCIRDVKREVKPDGTTTFTYNHSTQFGTPCIPYKDGAEKARMEDYARRNWTNCTPISGRACHAEYHFADVSIHHYLYRQGFKGTFQHDIVQAIGAAIEVLQDKPPRAPFAIADKKEAIFMLAHFIGDMHQPLHIGAVYLAKAGNLLNPDAPGGKNAKETQGGNLIGSVGKSMHSEWDAFPSATPDAALIDKAKLVPATPGDIGTWPAAWASDTVRASHTAFTGTTFLPKAQTKTRGTQKAKKDDGWNARYSDRAAYVETQTDLKQDQVAKGGARLAALLKAIFP